MLTAAQLHEMLHIQEKLNIHILGVDWRERSEVDFALAAEQECAEGIDHFAWKWWKDSKPNYPAAKMEVVDILHFGLSIMLALEDEREPRAYWVKDALEDVRNKNKAVAFGSIVYNPPRMSIVALFRLIRTQFYSGFFHLGTLVLCFEALGGTEDEMVRLYFEKAVLNMFRQDHGYKQGVYKKMWTAEKEDNDFIPDLAKDIDWTKAGAAQILYNRLSECYERVLSPETLH